MGGFRRILGFVLLVAVSLGIYWAVCAQERPSWPAPAVLPPGTPKPAPLDGPVKKQARKGTPHEPIVPVGGVMPRPQFPGMASETKKNASVPPPLPTLTEPIPPPIPEPTKVLIKEPPSKDAGKPESKVAPPHALIPPPLPEPEPKIDPPPVPPKPELKKDAIAPPPLVIPEPKINATPPAPLLTEPKKTSAPPPPTPPAADRMKSFVRVRPPGSDVPQPEASTGRDLPKNQGMPLPFTMPNAPAPFGLGLSNLLNVQTPSVTVEKRGALRIRAGEMETYQIVVRNLGPVPAQAVRVEDELASGVRIVNAQPTPTTDGNRVVWTLPLLGANQEQILRYALRADVDAPLSHRVHVNVSASSQSTTAQKPRSMLEPMAIRLSGPTQTAVGKTANFEIRVANQTGQPLQGLVLHGLFTEGLNTPQGRDIEGAVDGVIMPGEVKTLKMPASAVKVGRQTVQVKVSTKSGALATDSAAIDIVADGVLLQHAPATKMLLGRDGDVRIDLTNHSGKALRNVTVADRLPEGVEFVLASERGLYQANSRTVHWLVDQIPAGKTKSFYVRVNGRKPGSHANVATAKADGLAEIQASGVIVMEGIADLTMRVVGRDNHLEMGRETVYEIQVQNPGSVTATRVQLHAQFTPGLTPRGAEGTVRHTIDRQNVIFEPLEVLGPQGQAIFRVRALSQSVGDQRVRFSVISDQVRTPIQRDISTIVYRD